jgi:competence protein ComEC
LYDLSLKKFTTELDTTEVGHGPTPQKNRIFGSARGLPLASMVYVSVVNFFLCGEISHKRCSMNLQIFWRQHPALLFALSLLIGSSSFLFWETPWNYLFVSFFTLYLIYIRKYLILISLFGSFLYAFILYKNTPLLTTPTEIQALFSIDSVQIHHSPFQKSRLYKGTVYLKEGAFPCSIYYRGKEAPDATKDYLIQGILKQRGAYDYLLSAKEWVAVENSWSLAEMRYQIKESFRQFLHKKLSSRSALFLGSLITGDVEDRQLRHEFGKLGLQHILAISGFHFGLLIAFSSLLLGLTLSKFWKNIVLMIIINLYFLFIGALPAVQRSWLAAELYLGAKLLKRQTSGLNLLGCAMALEICQNPLITAHVGFQLSFLSCGGILLLHPLFNKYLKKWMPRRNRSEIGSLNLFSQHGYLFSSLFRQAFSLTLAVNCTILPLLLYHFHQFPILSLFYNLFFPFFVGGVLFLLLLALLLEWVISPLSSPLFSLTDKLTTYLLNLISYPPSQLDYSLSIAHFPAWIIPIYLFVLFKLALLLDE